MNIKSDSAESTQLRRAPEMTVSLVPAAQDRGYRSSKYKLPMFIYIKR